MLVGKKLFAARLHTCDNANSFTCNHICNGNKKNFSREIEHVGKHS